MKRDSYLKLIKGLITIALLFIAFSFQSLNGFAALDTVAVNDLFDSEKSESLSPLSNHVNDLVITQDYYEPNAVVITTVAVYASAKIIGYLYILPGIITWSALPKVAPLSAYMEGFIVSLTATIDGVSKIFLSSNQSQVISILNNEGCIWQGPHVGGFWICPYSS